jgi:AraC-like DNA-binding protein
MHLSEEEFLKSVLEFIEKNISNQELGSKMIADFASLSRSVLYSKFKVLTGDGVHEFIKSVRLKKSMQLLLERRMNVSEIAYEVGFNSPSYYTRCFIKKYGMSPKDYRRVKRGDHTHQTRNNERHQDKTN